MPDIDPPYRLDPYQNPVNIFWGGNQPAGGVQTFVWHWFFNFPTGFPDHGWLPVTDDFRNWATSHGFADFAGAGIRGNYTTRSALITAAGPPSPSDLFSDYLLPPSIGSGFETTWELLNNQHNSWQRPDGYSGPGGHGPWFYYFCAGLYQHDDGEPHPSLPADITYPPT